MVSTDRPRSETATAMTDRRPTQAAGAPIAIRSCNRIGLQANPPGFDLVSWFRRR